jgi:hypothetical protein
MTDPGSGGRLAHRVTVMVDAVTTDELIHEAPAIVGCRTPSALEHAGAPTALS